MGPELLFQEVGQTALGQAIYQDEQGELYVEKDYERLKKATPQELVGAKFNGVEGGKYVSFS